MKTRYIFIYFLFALTVPLNPEAQNMDVQFEHLTTEQGLSQSMVRCIVKDRFGFMWFGTEDGLNKYDGYKVTIYRNDPKNPRSLGSNYINALYEDRKGNLWVATDGGGLNLYDRNSNSFVRFLHYDSIATSLKDNTARFIYEDRKGNLWIGTYRGIDRMIDLSGKFEHYTIASSGDGAITEQVTCIIEDSENNLWVGTIGGLALFDGANRSFKLFVHNKKNKGSLSDSRITCLMEDENKNLWIGTQSGLNLINKTTGSFTHFFTEENNPNTISDNYIWALANEGQGKIWIGTEQGLDLFEKEKNLFAHFKNIPGDEKSLAHNSLRAAYVDNKGILWLGSFSGGISKYNKKLSRFATFQPINNDPSSLSHRMVSCFAENRNGDIWVGTDGGGLNLLNKKTGRFTRFVHNKNNPRGLQSNVILSLVESRFDDGLWIGSYDGGLSFYSYKTQSFTYYTKGDDQKHLSDNAIYALAEDKEGNLWIGTNVGGVNMLNRKTKTFTKKFLTGIYDGRHIANNCIRKIYQHTDGKIWIGTYNAGINIYDPVSKSFLYLDKKSSNLSNNIVLSIFGDSKGNVWVGTMGGLNLYNEKKKQFISFTEEDGLCNNFVNSIQEDGRGNLWISTKRGISRFDPRTKKFKNYGLHSGLQSYEFVFGAGHKSTTGEIYFGGINGFNVFNPDRMVENSDAPPIAFTNFLLSNKAIEYGENSPLKKHISAAELITLPFGKSVISFEFAALDYTISEENQYAYKLEGFDKDWIYCGTSRMATYTNLDPGTYTFRVKASNNDGMWNEEGASIRIVITPPFWQTWWFKLLASAILLGSVYGYYKMRMRAINQHRRQLELQVQERTQSLEQMTLELERKNKELEQFAYVASHDMQEPLRTITSFLDLLNQQYHHRFDEKAAKYMNFIVQASDRMKVLINDLLEYSRIGRKKESATVDLNETLSTVLADLNKAIVDSGARIKVGNMPVVKAYPTEMKQLFQNLIINAIKFRKNGIAPEIEIAADKKNGEWQFSVSDNGIGIDPKQTDRIFVIFQRLHTRNEYEGSGIGLSHCKKIAELHKGKIWVESTPGQGSTFYFTVKENRNYEKQEL